MYVRSMYVCNYACNYCLRATLASLTKALAWLKYSTLRPQIAGCMYVLKVPFYLPRAL